MMKRAMQLAVDHGMRFRPVPGREDIAEIFCPECDWPLIDRETVIEQYVREPYGCPHCSKIAKHG